MKESDDEKYWSPYLAGTLSGVVLVSSVLISGKFYGTSTTFVKTTGMIEKIFNAEQYTAEYCFLDFLSAKDFNCLFI